MLRVGNWQFQALVLENRVLLRANPLRRVQITQFRSMTNEKDAPPRTCQDLGPKYELLPDMYSEDFHEFEFSNRQLIADIASCEVIFLKEDCSLCGKGRDQLVVSGNAPRKMREYKRLIYAVYEAFYAHPRSYGQTGFSGPIRRESVSMHLEIKSTFDEVTGMACDDAEGGAQKRSKREIWRKTLGPEYANDD